MAAGRHKAERRGLSPYAFFTEERKQYEEERNRLNVKINSLRETARKDKSYRHS